jgi:predicted acyltransferase
MTEQQTNKPKRLVSLDALRGFDMFWIMGGENIIHALAQLTQWTLFLWLGTQMEHVEWNGFRFYDNIFPLFLFIAGITMPFSLSRRMEKGESKASIYRHIIFRGLILVLLGFIYNGLLRFDFENQRYASVLGRIGLAWMFAAIIFVNTKTRGQIIWFVAILLAYWAAMKLIPVPGHGAGVLTVEGSLAGYIDRMLVPGRLYLTVHDPEGLFSTIPAIATALMGVLTGKFLKISDTAIVPFKKGIYILAAGIVSIGLGWLWHLVFPVNKNLWTSSFVLVAGGWSLVYLAIFYTIIDVWKFQRWAFFFIVIGLNPITIYLAQAGMINFESTTRYFFGGLLSTMPELWQNLMGVIFYVGISWLFLYFLYRMKIFLKV